MFQQTKNSLLLISAVVILVALLINVSDVSVRSKEDLNEHERFKLAAEYSRQYRGLSVLVLKKGEVVFEEYQNGNSREKAHRLASGTKSFSGVMLAAAIEDGLVKSFDEKVSYTITEWKTDSRKKRITLRQLLSLRSGIDAGGIGRTPTYSNAIKFSARFEPGEKFQYGPVPFQVFGEVMKRKLAKRNDDVASYLKRRILDPIGLTVSYWRKKGAEPNLPSGAFLTAREWAKFGTLLLNQGKWNDKQIVRRSLLKELIKGSKANPNYGVTFWLNRSSNRKANIASSTSGRMERLMRRFSIVPETERISKNGLGKNLPKDMFLAAGAGKQRLYIIPSKNLVIVRQGNPSRFDDGKFLNRLLFGKIN